MMGVRSDINSFELSAKLLSYSNGIRELPIPIDININFNSFSYHSLNETLALNAIKQLDQGNYISYILERASKNFSGDWKNDASSLNLDLNYINTYIYKLSYTCFESDFRIERKTKFVFFRNDVKWSRNTLGLRSIF